jgi:4-aminobutyrate aminotransferase-like enzyme
MIISSLFLQNLSILYDYAKFLERLANDSVIEEAQKMSLLTYLGIFSVYCPRQVVALKGSYHGDTLGAMEAQAPSVYTGFKQQPW